MRDGLPAAYRPEGDAPPLHSAHCTYLGDHCMSWHCPYCGATISMMGHKVCLDENRRRREAA